MNRNLIKLLYFCTVLIKQWDITIMQTNIETIPTLLSEVLYNDYTNIYQLTYGNGTNYSDYSNIGLNEDLTDIKPGTYYYACSYLSYGDYDNSCHIERSNVRVFLDEYKEFINTDFRKLSGMYGSTSIYIDITTTNTDIIECIQGLFSYSCIDEGDCSNMESEILEETSEILEFTFET